MKTEFSKALISAGPRIHAVGLVVNVNEGSNLKLKLMIRLLRELKIDMKHIVIIVTHGDSLLPKPLPQEVGMRCKLRCERLEGQKCLTKLLSDVQNRYIVVENTQISERNIIIEQLFGHIASIAESPMTNDTFQKTLEWWKEQTAKRMKQEQAVRETKDKLLHLKLQREETDLRELRSKCICLEEEHSTVTSHLDKIDNIRQTLEEMRQVEFDTNHHSAMIAEANEKVMRIEEEICALRDQDVMLTELKENLRQRFVEKVKCFTSACTKVIQHREEGVQTLDKAADEIDKLMKNAAAAKVAGYSGSIVGGAIFTVGVGLLIGVLTIPVAAPFLVIGGVAGAMGSVVAFGGTAGQMIKKSVIMSSAKKWMKENKTMCEDLIEKHDTLTREHSRIIEVFPSFNTQLPQGITEISIIVSTWKEIIKFSATDATNLVAVAAGNGLGVAQGVLEAIDAGAEISTLAVKVAAKTAGSVAIGLSALVIVLDLGLLIKSGYDLDRLRKGHRSKVAKALINLAEAVREENNLLREAHGQFTSDNESPDHHSDDQSLVSLSHSQCTSGGNNSLATLVMCNPSLGNDERLHNGSSADLESHSNHPDEVLSTTSSYVAPQSCEHNESADHDSDDQSMVSLEAAEDESPSEVYLQSTGSITSCSQLQSDSDSASDSSSTLNISMDDTPEIDAPDTNNGHVCIIS